MMQTYHSIPFQQVDLQHGFWAEKQRQNRETTIYSVYQRFAETGRFDAFRFAWKEGMANQPHIFWDSDVAKWIESAAFILEKKEDARLEKIVDDVVACIEQHQESSGYFNIYFTVVEPENRFQKRTEHELYDAGHLIEAAVAYARATGKEKFLQLMCKYADHIEEVFKNNHSVGFYTSGHEEIELALVKLFRYTGEKRYLQLGQWFVEERGRHTENTYEDRLPSYDQHHVPVREMDTAEGHCVRALYLYCAMADLAYEYQDESMLAACRRLFENITQKRMYITGGIGSAREGEAFTIDYDLPNLTAYAETCASISMLYFCQRMLKCEADARYADIAEKVLYNGYLSGISLDATSFFYENPLEITPSLLHRDASALEKRPLAIPQRVAVFSCSCCPPNITRTTAALGDLLYTQSDDTLYVHHYIDSTTQLNFSLQAGSIRQTTSYPQTETVLLETSGLKGKRLAVRIPGWCKNARVQVNGNSAMPFTAEHGYALIPVTEDCFSVELYFEMPVTLIAASPHVRSAAGKVAVSRGPVVYCAEAVDNGADLWALAVDTKNFSPRVIPRQAFPYPMLSVAGIRRSLEENNLYAPVSAETETPQEILLLPYFCFANRGESEMCVWLNRM